MTTILVLFHSSHGSVRAMANEIADAAEALGANVLLRTFERREAHDIVVSKDDLIACNALAFGTPTRFGMMAAQAKQFWETTSDIWLKGQLIDKPACVFTSSSSMHGGQESTLLSMQIPLLHHGMVLCGIPYSQAALHSTQSGGTPYGATHVAHNNNTQLSADELQLAIAQGARLARLAIALQEIQHD